MDNTAKMQSKIGVLSNNVKLYLAIILNMDMQNSIEKTFANEKDQQEQEILVLWSGGADSTAMLIGLLKYTQFKLHVHHVDYITSQTRYIAEKNATINILKYLKEHFRTFKYTESTYKEIEPYHYQKPCVDTPLWAFIGGRIALSNPNIKYCCIGIINLNLVKKDGLIINIFATNIHASEKIFDSLFYRQKNRPLLIYPIINCNKNEILKDIPKNIGELFWSCRAPLFNEDNSYETCKTCHTCLDIIKAHIENTYMVHIEDIKKQNTNNYLSGLPNNVVNDIFIYLLFNESVKDCLFFISKCGFLIKQQVLKNIFLFREYNINNKVLLSIVKAIQFKDITEISNLLIEKINKNNKINDELRLVELFTKILEHFSTHLTKKEYLELLKSTQYHKYYLPNLLQLIITQGGHIALEDLFIYCCKYYFLDIVRERAEYLLTNYSNYLTYKLVAEGINHLLDRSFDKSDIHSIAKLYYTQLNKDLKKKFLATLKCKI